MEQETVGREWGGDDRASPTGLNRAPTFSGYGWNPRVAGQLSKHTLVMQGLKDGVLPTGPGTGQAIYEALHKALPESTVNKVLVKVQCASHALLWEGSASWAGPHATFKEALIEWIKNGTFKDASSGSFIVNASGVVSAES
jgi:pimeloyl-ACP methyl ester carboxylesterase